MPGMRARSKNNPGVHFGASPTCYNIGVFMTTAAIVANTIRLDQLAIPLSFETTDHQFAAAILSEVQIFVGTLATVASSGSHTFLINQVDINGNIIATLASVTIPYNSHFVAIDVRNNNNGIILTQGMILRLDSGTLAPSTGVGPTGVNVRLYGGAYSVTC